MHYELAKFLLGGFLAEVLFIVISLSLVTLGYLLYKIWSADPEDVEEVRKLKHTVRLANSGVPNAILACENDHRVNKGLRYVDGTIVAHYSVPSWVSLRAFNMY